MENLNFDTPPELITNIEVMLILQERMLEREQGRKDKAFLNRDWIEKKVLEHLIQSPCAQADFEKLPSLVKTLKNDLKLKNAESLQVLNYMPKESVEIHLMIGELQTRLSEPQQRSLLKSVQECMKNYEPPKEKDPSDEDEEVVGEVDEEEIIGQVDNDQSVDPVIKQETPL